MISICILTCLILVFAWFSCIILLHKKKCTLYTD
jgi:hypothetical protein